METKVRMALAAVLMTAFATSSALATDLDDCVDKWGDSEAYEFCSGATVSWWSAESLCRVVGSCSITVNVDEVSTTFTPGLNHTKSKTNIATLDICFDVTTTVEAHINQRCGTYQYTSSQATTSGLTTENTE